ncbi:uncharacterized protein LOC129268162 [Lytechinus pictus]|uniref:uncharacterized protein LOC129268162 n=1 Tax=Lytechinus pictus TaxID=7653 RepID=UPI0030B9DFFB
MSSSRDMETIELSEAIKTILDDSPQRKNDCSVSTTITPQSRKTSPRGLTARFSVGQSTTPNSRSSAKGSETPLSRKSSILQRSTGSNPGSSQRKRRHAQEVIILRPPKKRASGSTPRVTSTSKLTPSSQSTPKPASTTPSLKNSLQTTPLSSQSRSRINPHHIANFIKTDEKRLTDAVFVTPELSMTPNQISLVGGQNLSLTERENSAHQDLYHRLMEQQGSRLLGGGGALQEDSGVSERFTPGGLSLNVADQTSKISLIARGHRGNQDDSLTNITWLRRMSAPDLDPITRPHMKSHDPHKERPPYSYSSLIQFAISSAPEGKLTLRDIYFWIETNFPYFRTAKLGWKNSIRHNLSLHKIFVREAPSGPGQPAFWTLRPGTVVRLPERKVVVHEEIGMPTRMPECFVPDHAIDMATMANLQMQVDPTMNPLTGNNILLGDPQNIPMLSAQDGTMINRAPVLTSTPVIPKPNMKGSKRVPPILPKGTPPYALVPLPIYFTKDPKTGQLVPANGDNPSPDMMALDLSGTTKSKTPRKTLPRLQSRSPDSTPVTRAGQGSGGLGRFTLDSGYGSTDSSLGDDNRASLVRDSKLIRSEAQAKCESGKENSLSAEFGLGLDVDDDLLKTPPKTTCPEWLSPIRGFSPVPDTGFSIKDMDFNFTPFKTGLTPNNRAGHSNTPRHLMLSPVNRNVASTSGGVRSSRKARLMTPRRHIENKEYLMNSSFEKMFGDVSFDMDPDNIDVGNMSWLLNSPPPVK